MKPEIYDSLLDEHIPRHLNDGKIGIIPTDTVYGIVACAKLPNAATRLYSVKDRISKPGTIIASSIDQLVELGFHRRYLTPVMQFWPGAVSVVLPHDIQYLHLGLGAQAIRVVENEALTSLLDKTGPLLTTSANVPNQETVRTIDEAHRIFGDKIDFYVNGGNLQNHLPSTIIRIVDDAIEVLREGAVKINEKGEISN